MNDERTDYPVKSLTLESNYGGYPVTICACGVMLAWSPSSWAHIDNCPAVLAHLNDAGAS